MLDRRKMSGCGTFTLEDDEWIAVAGGIGPGERLLKSVEVMNWGQKEAWKSLSPLSVARFPTVVDS